MKGNKIHLKIGEKKKIEYNHSANITPREKQTLSV